MPPEPIHYVISFPAHPWALVAYITNYSTLLLLRLLSALLGRVTHLPRKGLEPLLKDPSPYKAATSYLVCSSMLPGTLLGRSRSRHSKRRWIREKIYRTQQTPVRDPKRDSDLFLVPFGPLRPVLAKPLRGRYALFGLLCLLADCPLRRCAPLSSLQSSYQKTHHRLGR